jgi:hypothetical protein
VTSSFSGSGDTESENYSVVIGKIGSHSAKSTVLKHGTLMGIYIYKNIMIL